MREAEGRPFRWAIIGTGRIAASFAAAIRSMDGVQLRAVCSRDLGRANEFGARWGAGRAVASPQGLVADPGVDAVYVATPVPAHRELVDLLVGAGLPVLVEKPFARTAAEARLMVEAARAAGVFVMEAMWTRFLPAFVEIRAEVAAGRIGAVTSVNVGLGIPVVGSRPADDWLWSPELGGGGLLEVGVYCAQLVQEYLGMPDSVVATGTAAATGVDLTVGATLRHGSAVSAFQSSIDRFLDCSATIVGEYGTIRVPPFFHAADGYALSTLTGEADRPLALRSVDAPHGPYPLVHEVAHVIDRVRAGALDSEIMPVSATIETLAIVDHVRSAAVLG